MSKDKTTTNKDGSTTVVRETTDPYPDTIPFDEEPTCECDDCVDSVEPGLADDLKSGVYASPLGAVFKIETKETVEKLKRDIERLTAHLVSKGYGSAAIRRILAGETVR